jgi:hypothetical protein
VATAKIVGLDETVRALRQFDPAALKEMNKTIYQALKIAQTDARQLAPAVSPLSGWARPVKEGRWADRTFTPRAVKMGLKTKIDRARRRGTWTSKAYLLINSDAAGSIYETAGRKNPKGNSKQGANFNKLIARQSGIIVRGKQGRIAYKAVEDNRTEIIAMSMAAIDKAQTAVNRKLAK